MTIDCTMSASRAAHATRSIPVYADTIGRAVHIKMHPQPRTMAESTEVLRVLQQYGEVAMYKHLKVKLIIINSTNSIC